MNRYGGKYQKTRYPGIFKYVGGRGEVYGIDYYAGGRRHREIVGLRLTDAREELEKRRKAGRSGIYISQMDKRKNTFEDLAEKYRELKEKNNYFQNTETIYLDMLKECFKDRKLVSIGPEDIQRFRKERKEKLTRAGKPRSNSSVNRELGLLRHLLNTAVLYKMLEKNPFDEFRNQLKRTQSKDGVFFQEQPRDRCLTSEEAKKLLPFCAPHLQNIILGCLYTGLRVRDLLNLRWDDIRWGEESTLTYTERKKGDKRGEKPLTADMIELLGRIPKIEGGLIFTGSRGKPIKSPRGALKRACKKAGIKNLQMRDLRRSHATVLMEKGVPIPVIQKDLGHAKITTTEIYLNVNRKLERRELAKMDGYFVLPPSSDGQKMVRSELTEETPVAGTT